MSYGSNQPDLFRRAGEFVDKILRRAKPADIPIEQPTKFDLVVNLITARALDLTVPPNIIARASHTGDQDRYVMSVCIRSLSLNPGRFCRSRSAEHVWARVISLLALQSLPPNRRSSGSEAIIANPLRRSTPRNLSTSLLARTSTRHARPNPHS